MKIFKLYLPLLSILVLNSLLQGLFAQESITWKTLEDVSYEMSYDSTADYVMMTPVYGESLNKLQGQEVEIKGYILPMDTEGSAYVLSAFPFSSCFFCGGAGPESVVELQMEKKQANKLRLDQRVRIQGVFQTNDSDFDHCNYILKDAIPLKK